MVKPDDDAARCTTTCPRCGRAFRCGVTAGDGDCWCMRLPPGPPLPRLGDGKACFCPDCLAALRAEQLKAAG